MKISPWLIPYDDLPDDIKQYDVDASYAIPAILKEMGYEIYREEEPGELTNKKIVDAIAKRIHEGYAGHAKRQGKAAQSFDDLTDEKKELNRDFARCLPRMLKAVGYGMRPRRTNEEQKPLVFDDGKDKSDDQNSEISRLARLEHNRWMWKTIMQGWKYAPGDKDKEKKTTPYLIPWEELKEKVKKEEIDKSIVEHDYRNVRLISELLQEIGYTTYKLESKK